MASQYAWKYGSKADAQKVGVELETIYEEHGKLTPVLIVEDARNPERETHQLIEWDDTTAATSYRLEQARYVIRNLITVRREESAEPAEARIIKFRVFEDVVTEDEGRHFMPMQVAIGRNDTREYLLQQALKALVSFRQKYGMINELAVVLGAIEDLERKYTGIQLAA